MIFIVVKFETQPQYADQWPTIVADFTHATRAELGNLWFEWSRSLDNCCEYVLLEGFVDAQAGHEHVKSAHFQRAMTELPSFLATTPQIISQTLEESGWSLLAEMTVPEPHSF